MESSSIEEKETPAAETAEPSCFNPGEEEIQTEDGSLMEKVKGDAIGDTLYSQRFVLSTLMKLSKMEKPLADDEEFEKALCTLWDQTVEKDVVKFLLDYNVLEIFAGVINEDDPRLTEILVGMVANMACLPETRHILETSPEVTSVFMNLVSCSDAPTLIQLMRLFQTALVFENSGNEIIWFHHFRAVEDFVEKFAFILSSSTSSTLLRHALEALNAICTKFAVIEIQPDLYFTTCRFRDMFVRPCMIAGLVEAFKQVVPISGFSIEATFTPTENVQKFTSLFLDVNVILSQYEEQSKYAYAEFLDEFLSCIVEILTPLCQPVFLFPLSSRQQGTVENVSDILLALGYPFRENLWEKLVLVWHLLEKHRRQNKDKRKAEWSDDEDGDDEAFECDSDAEVSAEELQATVMECIARSCIEIEGLRLRKLLEDLNPAIGGDLLEGIIGMPKPDTYVLMLGEKLKTTETVAVATDAADLPAPPLPPSMTENAQPPPQQQQQPTSD